MIAVLLREKYYSFCVGWTMQRVLVAHAVRQIGKLKLLEVNVSSRQFGTGVSAG